MNKDDVLNEIFGNDPLGLLEIKPKAYQTRNSDERLVASFEEINAFVDREDREPQANMANIAEYQLHHRLKGILSEPDKHIYLVDMDRHGLLKNAAAMTIPPKPQPKEINSIDDIFGDDDFDLLGDDTAGLFDFNHAPKQTTMPEYVARRKPCKEFEKFEHLFVACQQEVPSGIRNLVPFKNEQQIHSGCFYVLQGVLLFVESVGKREMIKGKVNARLRCIFENGTESDMMLRSLAAELYKDGRRVTANEDELLDGLRDISEQDHHTGYIYILKSLSTLPEIREIPHLFKIGLASTTVEERIKNAENEPTYLMSKVKIVATYRCFNMNVHKFESLIHRVFNKACVHIEVSDNKGNMHTPREWFNVPLPIIEQVIAYILNGEIQHLVFNPDNERLEYRA